MYVAKLQKEYFGRRPRFFTVVLFVFTPSPGPHLSQLLVTSCFVGIGLAVF
jgi:hypothetical protein